ncbi:Hypothetical predicted protein [Octopus vulgaris]|uniref:Uncharacterized protein n=1 Tax=Octopus vulgaris TaxID=6645 RepID=A0AA36EZJ7_OCTVU|nr:Hypothetical predicted protein [Octopus vulgaris]
MHLCVTDRPAMSSKNQRPKHKRLKKNRRCRVGVAFPRVIEMVGRPPDSSNKVCGPVEEGRRVSFVGVEGDERAIN